jgi:hypothetical protein
MKQREFHWLRGVDLNHRPLGYEPKRLSLTPVDSVAVIPRTGETPAKTALVRYPRFAGVA